MRRTFRLGIRLGILAGVAFAVMKIIQSRRENEPVLSPSTAAWPPVTPPAPPPPPPPVAQQAPTPTPVAKAASKATKSVKKANKAVKKATTATKKATTTRAWVEPQGQVCPLSHPIKAKLASSIYHLPGMLNYTRTRPDRCYAVEAAAQRDGLTAAKR